MQALAIAIALAVSSSPAVQASRTAASVAFDDDTLQAMAADAGWYALVQGSGMVRDLTPAELGRRKGGKGHK